MLSVLELGSQWVWAHLDPSCLIMPVLSLFTPKAHTSTPKRNLRVMDPHYLFFCPICCFLSSIMRQHYVLLLQEKKFLYLRLGAGQEFFILYLPVVPWPLKWPYACPVGGLNMQPLLIHIILSSCAPLLLQASFAKGRFSKSNISLCVWVLGKRHDTASV